MRYIANLSSTSSKPRLKNNWEAERQTLQNQEASTSSDASTPTTCSPDADPCKELQDVITRNDIVHVEWIDAQTTGGSGWQDSADMVEAMYAPAPHVHTCGYLMHSDEHRIAICDTIQADGAAGGYVHLIPNGMIIDIEWLTGGGKDIPNVQ